VSGSKLQKAVWWQILVQLACVHGEQIEVSAGGSRVPAGVGAGLAAGWVETAGAKISERRTCEDCETAGGAAKAADETTASRTRAMTVELSLIEVLQAGWPADGMTTVNKPEEETLLLGQSPHSRDVN